MFLPLLLAAVVGYLLGALPFGWLISRKFGINIFEHGSKNPGATNVKRVLGEKFGKRGKRAGDLAFALDALKGAAAAGWPLWYARYTEFAFTVGPNGASFTWFDASHAPAMAITGLVFALVGHSFSCWTRFKGGKGVATTAGGLLVLLPLPTVFAVIAWIATFYASRYVSLASIVSAVVLPLSAWLVPGVPCAFAILATVVCSFVILRHRANIARLLNGTENKFAKKPAA
ncbi:MAG: glycerol-3-phosphate 1-O-acyltransferase PlsY [Burkholderiales bacterium]|nr:glycerol-3-phosphate 1-O-acyltransferase PlsY [Opitutaceae bacterium]